MRSSESDMSEKMSDNMKIWNAVKRPPEWALKKIAGGRLKGMTDISPQWRYQVMTEQFGVCGVGWWFEIKRTWTEPAPDGEIMVFAEIALFLGGDISIPGIGGSRLISQERNGLHASDEGYKMAVTDALSTAMKMIGIGADIYSGQWDGTKYKDHNQPEPDTLDSQIDAIHAADSLNELKAVFASAYKAAQKARDDDRQAVLKIAYDNRKAELGG